MKRKSLLKIAGTFLLLCLLPACTSVREEKQPLLIVTDFTGEEISLPSSFTLTLPGFYGRKTTGLFADNRTQPELFEETKLYQEKKLEQSNIHWQRYSSESNFQNFELFSAESSVVVDREYKSSKPVSQNALLLNLPLTGILRLVEQDFEPESAYAYREKKGDLIFYPYPNRLGDFPFSDLEDDVVEANGKQGIKYPLYISGNHSDYQAIADTVRIPLGNINDKILSERLPETMEQLFARGDLIEAEIVLNSLEIEYSIESPLVYRARVQSITKTADL